MVDRWQRFTGRVATHAVTDQPFPKLMHDLVLEPIGMTHSTYEQPLPAGMRSLAATPYNDDGTPIKGGAHTYPEMAAAGLWTTPSDIARYILENQRSLEGKANHVLSPEMTKEMMTAGQRLNRGSPAAQDRIGGGYERGCKTSVANVT